MFTCSSPDWPESGANSVPSQGLEQAADCGCLAEDAWAAPRGPGAIWRSPPQSADGTPHPYPRAPLPGRHGFPDRELLGSSCWDDGCLWGGVAACGPGREYAFTSVCSFPPCASRLLIALCLLRAGWFFCSASWGALSPGSLGYFHYNSVPLRMPSSACVGMTHLALVIGKSLSLMKRHWTRTSQPPFQPLPGLALPQHRQDLTSSHQEMHK